MSKMAAPKMNMWRPGWVWVETCFEWPNFTSVQMVHTHHNKSRARRSLLERAMEGEICRCYDMLQDLQYILAWFGCAFRFDNARAISLDELPTRQSPGAILQGLGLWESLFPDKWGGIWRTGDWRGRALTTWCEWMRTRHCNGLLPFVTIKSYNIHKIYVEDMSSRRMCRAIRCRTKLLLVLDGGWVQTALRKK